MSMDYRAIDFLNNFDEETRKHIIEFGKRISSKDLESDVFLVMARKAICFVDFLREVKLVSLNGIVVSDRILDMNTEWLTGKSVTVIDDALVSGTTLKKVINKLENSGVSKIQVFVLSINKDWYNPEMLTDSDNSNYLSMPRYYNTNEKCMQMCYDIVKALSTIPRPYDIDFPLYGEYSIEKAKLNEMLNASWSAFNVTSSSHISNSYASRKNAPKSIMSDYESITFIPPESIIKSLYVLTGIDFKNSCILKIRSYIKKRTRKTSQYTISFLPFVIFNEISKNDIDCIIEHLFHTTEAQEIINSEMITYESKFRFVQFIIATFLMKIFFADMNFCKEESLNVPLSEKIFLPIVTRMYYIFTPNVVNLITNLINSDFTYIDSLSISSTFLDAEDSNNIESLYNENSLVTYDILANKFMELYKKREIKARTLAKEYGKNVFNLPQYQKDMKRLEEGYTFRNLVCTLEESNRRNFIVSIFLDFAIDTGIAVPITYIKNQKIVRAYRHGEDVIFTDVEAKQLTFMLNCFLEISKRKEIPALLLEKLLTTFIRFGLHDSIFEKYDYKNIHSQERDFIKIAYYIHGTTTIVSNTKALIDSKPIITSDTKSKWLKDVLVSKKLLKEISGKTEDLSTYYIEDDVAKRMIEEHQPLERGKVAKRISRVIGYLYNKKVITEKDLVLLNASFGHDQIIPALLAEVRVILDNYKFFKHIVMENFDKWHAMNAIVSFRNNHFFTAQNSGFMKLNSYYNQEPRNILERVKNSNPGDFETEHFYDEFERYWDEKLSNVKEEIPAEIERQINLAAIFIIQYGLIFRTIELIIFLKHIGSKGVLEYFTNLKNEIDNRSAIKRSEVVQVIREYNETIGNSNVFSYFKIVGFEVNSNTIKDDALIKSIAKGIPLKVDIENYITYLKRFSASGNLLNHQQAIDFATLALDKWAEIDLDAIFRHLEMLNQRAEGLIIKGCKYINNRGEIEAPVEYTNLIIINQCEDNANTSMFYEIQRVVQDKQKKIRDRKNDAELIFQECGGRLLIMARGAKTDEALVNLACNIETTLNCERKLRINTILNLNGAYSPYRFESCIASANVITFFEWYDKFQDLHNFESHFIILSEFENSIKNSISEQLEKTIINSQPYAGLLGKEYYAMYLNENNGALLHSSTKGFTIGVICAKENERNGILKSLKNNFNVELEPQIDKKENHRLIDIGTINYSGVNHTIIVTKCEQGNTSAANAYSSLVHFKPDYVVFVGIAGTCNPKEVELGDVILPSEIVDATLKKETNDKIQLRASSYRIPGNHVGLIQLFVRLMAEKYNKFKLLNSRIISDNYVYACDDSEILKSVLKYNDKIDGIEMESAGIYSADYERNKIKYGVFTIRGVSDNANSVKDDAYHEIAISNASQVFCDFIRFIFTHIDDIKDIK